MYDDNVTYRVGINWKDILIKFIMLVLFVIILLLLFPKADLDVFYDTVYSNNVNTMKEAARNYYTIDRLPSNVGDKTSMTLKEMIDNHMLIRFTDKNGNACNEDASLVEVTKLSDDEYTLKVQLKCGEQDDYILETIGCTTVCSNGTCKTVISDNTNTGSGNSIADSTQSNSSNNTVTDTNTTVDAGNGLTDGDLKGNSYVNKITYYQHKKAVSTTSTLYSCPAGYIKNGTKCTKTSTSATLDATPSYNPDQVITTDAKYNDGGNYKIYADYIKEQVDLDYSCPSGYTLNGVYCIKYTSATQVSGGVTYTCPYGYTKNGTKCTKTYSATYKGGSTSYSCPNGGTLNGTKCTITTTASSNGQYSCPAGYTQSGSSCYKVYTASAKTSNGYYTCPNGGTLNGSKCVTSGTSYNATAKTTYGSWVAKGTQYYTSAAKSYQNTTSWLQLNGMITGAACGSPCGGKGTWYKYTYYTRSANISYSCPNGGTLSGSKCVTSGTSYNATYHGGTTSYSCPNGGTLNGSTCTLTTNATISTSYSCPSGYTQSGSSCIKTYNATGSTATGYYTCPNGGTLSGSTCYITIDATKVVGDTYYSCPSGYTYNSSKRKCQKKISATITPEYRYSCPTGYTRTGSGTNTKCYKVIKGQGNYYCEDAGATLNGTKCVKKVNGGISHYTCPTGYTLSGTKCSKTTSATIDATATTKTNTSYKYKWSKSSSLDGWEFTGKTKVVKETYKAGQK